MILGLSLAALVVSTALMLIIEKPSHKETSSSHVAHNKIKKMEIIQEEYEDVKYIEKTIKVPEFNGIKTYFRNKTIKVPVKVKKIRNIKVPRIVNKVEYKLATNHRDPIYINSDENLQTEIFIYNVVGQEILSKKAFGKGLTSIKISSGTGYYLVKVLNDNLFVTNKVFIK